MTASKLIFPGTSGNYISRPNVNLLDADSAHIHQSIGDWIGWAALAPTQSQDISALFGDYVLKVSLQDGDTAAGIRCDLPALDASTEYTVSMGVYSEVPIGPYLGGSFGGRVLVSGDGIDEPTNFSHAGNGWETYAVTFTSGGSGHAAGAVDVYVQFRQVSTPAEEVYIDQVCLCTGSSTEFIPSLNISGDLDLRFKMAATDWSPTANEAIISTGTVTGVDGYIVRFAAGSSGDIEVFHGDGSTARSLALSPSSSLSPGASHEGRITVVASTLAAELFIDGISQDTGTLSGTTGDGSPSGLDLLVGAWTGGHELDAELEWAEARDGIDGPVVARCDADDWVGVSGT